MTGSIEYLAVIADATLAAALWVAIVRRAIPRRGRFPVAVLGFGSAWALAFVLLRWHAPGWMLAISAAAVVSSILLVVAAAQLSLPGDGGAGGASDDGGGGLGRRPPEKPTGGGPAEPSWWPEFEADLNRYMAERARAQRDRDPIAP